MSRIQKGQTCKVQKGGAKVQLEVKTRIVLQLALGNINTYRTTIGTQISFFPSHYYQFQVVKH